MTESDINFRFSNLISRIENENWPVFGAEIYKNNQLVNHFGNTSKRFPLYSISKSITSIGFGIAENEGLINIDDLLLKYIPDEFTTLIEKEQLKLFENISLERFLTMSVKGFDFRPSSDNYLLYSLNTKIFPDIKEFHYTNICAYLISVALTTAVGKPLYEYLNEKIFVPMEIEKPSYQKSPEGFFYGATGIELSVHELSKIGLMLINNGIFNNKEIVPEKYIKRATDIQIMNKEGGYGYFFQKFGKGFSLNGKWGQKCFCIPQEGIVLSVLGNFQDGSQILKDEVKGWFC